MQQRTALYFLLPAIIVMAVITLYPFIYTVVLSLHNWNLTTYRGKTFVGLENYGQFLTDEDARHSLKVTFVYLVCTVGFEFVLGVAIAFLFDTRFKGREFFRNVLLLPMVMSPVVAGLIWRWIFNADLGLANYFMEMLGFQSLPWLTSSDLALFSVILADIWQWTPFIFLVAFAGLQSVPVELTEAASLDGASWLDIQRFVTLPIMKPILLTGLLIRTIDALKFVDKIFVLTYGGPGSATSVFGFLIYLRGFKYFQMGLTAAYALVLLLFIILLANLLIYSVRRENA